MVADLGSHGIEAVMTIAGATVQAQTREALEHAVARTLATITVADARSGFHHCGSAL
jgi:hypothetical protein